MPVIPAVAIIGSAAIGAAASSSAAKKTAQAAKDTATANNDLQRDIYNRNTQNMQPYLAGGNRAWDAWQSFMGLTPQAQTVGSPQPAVTQPQVQPQTGSYGSYTPTFIGDRLMQREAESGLGVNAMSMGGMGDPQVQPQMTGNAMNPAGTPSPATGTGNALSGYDAFKASTGYQTGLDEGMRSLNTKLASGGRLFAGDAGRAAVRYGQQYADTFAGDYLSRLMQGTQVGTGAANALAGVGTSYANAVGNNNNTALNAQANANQATGNALGGLASAVGQTAGYYYGQRPDTKGSSYSQPASGTNATGYGRPIFWG